MNKIEKKSFNHYEELNDFLNENIVKVISVTDNNFEFDFEIKLIYQTIDLTINILMLVDEEEEDSDPIDIDCESMQTTLKKMFIHHNMLPAKGDRIQDVLTNSYEIDCYDIDLFHENSICVFIKPC